MKLSITLLLVLGFSVMPIAASAAFFSNPLGSPFGGRITLIIPCTCSVPPTMLKITVGPPAGGSFLYIPGLSTLYKHNNLLPPSWVLGLSREKEGIASLEFHPPVLLPDWAERL